MSYLNKDQNATYSIGIMIFLMYEKHSAALNEAIREHSQSMNMGGSQFFLFASWCSGLGWFNYLVILVPPPPNS